MHRSPRGSKVMSALQPDGFITHEWEADRHLYRGSMLDVVNEASGSFSVR
jgi:hypothetical protein